MWKDYSVGSIKNNRAFGISIMVAAFISALLLSLLCSMFYNLWNYEVQRIKAEEGDWQGRITGEITMEQLSLIQSYANVERAELNEELSKEAGSVVDLYFENVRSIFADLPRIAKLAGLDEEAVSYHYSLLNLYLVRDARDPALRWVFPFFLGITVIACLSLILVIHNAFGVTMHARVRQFGIFSSIGATPGQIRTCLLQEALALCALPLVAGNLLGILICMGMVAAVNLSLADVSGRLALPFAYHPLILVLSLLVTAITIWISAWLPARRMSKLTPLEAIKNTGELSLKRKRSAPLVSRFFGIEGMLAKNALAAQKKAMRTATLSLVFSFLAFSLMMCFFSITIISQRETYFEKYQDAWDVMATLKDTDIADFQETEAVQGMPGVKSGVVYQKALAKRIVTPKEPGGEFQAIGGYSAAPAQYVTQVPEGWLVNAPLMILDDASFLAYCQQIGAEPRLDGAVILNQTRDATDPNFRKRRILSYLTGESKTTRLLSAEQEDIAVEIPVTAYTREVPLLREEYGTLDFYELVHFIPLSLWKEIGGQIGGGKEDTYIRILAKEGATGEELNTVQDELSGILGDKYEAELENRIQDRENNDRMMKGMMAVLSVFCVLLAVIGIGNIFSNTLGFVRQRRREFARYLSLGLTPAGMKKIFCVEALLIAGRPVLITLPVTAIVAAVFLRASYLEPAVFLREMPLLPILAFLLAIIAFVALAYYLGGRKMMRISLAETLKDDTMM